MNAHVCDHRKEVGQYMLAEPVGTAPHETYLIWDRRGHQLGYVEWYSRWRCHVFVPDPGLVLSADCCAAMSTFLGGIDER